MRQHHSHGRDNTNPVAVVDGQAHGLLLWALFLVLRRTSDGFTLPPALEP
jgi:hypothetical protein